MVRVFALVIFIAMVAAIALLIREKSPYRYCYMAYGKCIGSR